MNSDEEDNDTLVTIGTPLPVLNDDEILNRKPIKLHEQVVRDEKGRIRFHGAFTGGFSAGYFNTVDTKEGWAPKSFVSSRDKRTEKTNQHPEDYMDDEDFGEFGIAPKRLQRNEKYAQNIRSDTTMKLSEGNRLNSDIATSFLNNILQPSSSNIGFKLLRKLGWKDGQGVGERISRKRKFNNDEIVAKENEPVKIYSCELPPDFKIPNLEQSNISDDEIDDRIDFAPEDISPIEIAVKNNYHGIGYSGITARPFTLFTEVTDIKIGSKTGKGIKGQAFGVGAFETEDANIYATDSIHNYDFSIEDERQDDKLHGWTKPSIHRKLNDPEVNAVVTGFLKAKSILQPHKRFSPPSIPRDFKFEHKKIENITNIANIKKGCFTAEERANILQEAPHLNTVFELISKEDQAKIESAKNNLELLKNKCKDTTNISNDSKDNSLPTHINTLLPLKSNSWEANFEKANDLLGKNIDYNINLEGESLSSVNRTYHLNKGSHLDTNSVLMNCSVRGSDYFSETIPGMDKDGSTNSASKNTIAGAMFKPFASCIEKQMRYEKFVEAQKNHQNYVHSEGCLMTDWERDMEREEFMKAFKLYRPLSSMIQDRFTRATHSHDDYSIKKEEIINQDDKLNAKICRDVVQWHPDKLLCKRFNIADPYPNSTIIGLPDTKKEKLSIYNFLELSRRDIDTKPSHNVDNHQKELTPNNNLNKTSKFKPLSILSTVDLRPKNITTAVPIIQQDNQKEKKDCSIQLQPTPETEFPIDMETETRPPMDLYKAIFDNSDTSDDDNEQMPQSNTHLTVDKILLDASSNNISNIPNIIAVNSNNLDTINKCASPMLKNVNDSLLQLNVIQNNINNNIKQKEMTIDEKLQSIRNSSVSKTVDVLHHYDVSKPQTNSSCDYNSSLNLSLDESMTKYKISNENDKKHSKKRKSKDSKSDHHKNKKHKSHKHKHKKEKKSRHHSTSSNETTVKTFSKLDLKILKKLKKLTSTK